MTNKELINILSKYPEDSIVLFRHNQRGRIDIDFVESTEETMLSGEKKKFITLEASFEEG